MTNQSKQSPKDEKVNVINAVKTPLSFFTLLILVVEVVFGIIASMSSGNDRTYLIIGTLSIIFTLVLLVAFMAIFRPASLRGITDTPKDKATFEQTVENMNNALQKFGDYIEKEQDKAEKITDIVDDTLEHTRDTWLKLLLIRMTLRRLLLKVASANTVSFVPSTSISKMNSRLREAGIIDQYLYTEVDRIRAATYIVEWGQGQQPALADIRFTLENAHV